MATYPVINKETGEQKEVVMSVNDWDQWRGIILIGLVIIQIHQQCQVSVKSENGKINFVRNILVGMRY